MQFLDIEAGFLLLQRALLSQLPSSFPDLTFVFFSSFPLFKNDACLVLNFCKNVLKIQRLTFGVKSLFDVKLFNEQKPNFYKASHKFLLTSMSLFVID